MGFEKPYIHYYIPGCLDSIDTPNEFGPFQKIHITIKLMAIQQTNVQNYNASYDGRVLYCVLWLAFCP